MNRSRINNLKLAVWLAAAIVVAFGAAPAEAGKQLICHFPPGNEVNFHTIVVSDNAVNRHVEKHGDLIGSCLANCEGICDDGDVCTQDVLSDPNQCVCLAEPTPVDCDDSNECTADSCSPVNGACVYDTGLLDGEACDGDPGVPDEVCTAGVCGVPTPTGCPCWVAPLPGQGADACLVDGIPVDASGFPDGPFPVSSTLGIEYDFGPFISVSSGGGSCEADGVPMSGLSDAQVGACQQDIADVCDPPA